MPTFEVFADIACPFAHASLQRIVAHRRQHPADDIHVRVRAWPLEVVNDAPHSGHAEEAHVEAIRAQAAPTLFAGFDSDSFPSSTMAALAAEAAAYRADLRLGEAFSFAVRDALWEHGLDVSDVELLRHLAAELGVPAPTPEDDAAVLADHEEGKRRGVQGSPHLFTDHDSFFCPSLDISEAEGNMLVRPDDAGFRAFLDAAVGT